MNRLALAALSGMASSAAAQPVLHIASDVTNVGIGGTITWTVSVTGIAPADFVSSYDFDFIATVNGVGVGALSPLAFSTFATQLSVLVNPTPGTPGPGELAGVSGGQSTLLDPANTVFGNVALGTFQTQVVGGWNGKLSVTLVDGGVLSGTDVFRTRNGSDFGPITFNGLPTIVASRLVIPAPATAALVAAGLLAARRRR